jgi:hypothetical protein
MANRRPRGLADIVYRASHGMIPYNHFRFKHIGLYEILSPITNMWQEIEIPRIIVSGYTLPPQVCDAMDYYVETKRTMDFARDIQIFNGDIRPLNDDEKRLFGVREGQNNPCFPKRKRNR